MSPFQTATALLDSNFVLPNACWFRACLVALLMSHLGSRNLALWPGRMGLLHLSVQGLGFSPPFRPCSKDSRTSNSLPVLPHAALRSRGLCPIFSPGPPRLCDSGHRQCCSIPGTSTSVRLCLCYPSADLS